MQRSFQGRSDGGELWTGCRDYCGGGPKKHTPYAHHPMSCLLQVAVVPHASTEPVDRNRGSRFVAAVFTLNASRKCQDVSGGCGVWFARDAGRQLVSPHSSMAFPRRESRRGRNASRNRRQGRIGGLCPIKPCICPKNFPKECSVSFGGEGCGRRWGGRLARGGGQLHVRVVEARSEVAPLCSWPSFFGTLGS